MARPSTSCPPFGQIFALMLPFPRNNLTLGFLATAVSHPQNISDEQHCYIIICTNPQSHSVYHRAGYKYKLRICRVSLAFHLALCYPAPLITSIYTHAGENHCPSPTDHGTRPLLSDLKGSFASGKDHGDCRKYCDIKSRCLILHLLGGCLLSKETSSKP